MYINLKLHLKNWTRRSVYRGHIAFPCSKIGLQLVFLVGPCVTRFFRNFYRAQIIFSDLSNRSCTIRYIDYGNVVEVSSNSLCVIQPQFLNVPPYAIQCRIHNKRIPLDCHISKVLPTLKILLNSCRFYPAF